jgi:hypothetical protein
MLRSPFSKHGGAPSENWVDDRGYVTPTGNSCCANQQKPKPHDKNKPNKPDCEDVRETILERRVVAGEEVLGYPTTEFCTTCCQFWADDLWDPIEGRWRWDIIVQGNVDNYLFDLQCLLCKCTQVATDRGLEWEGEPIPYGTFPPYEAALPWWTTAFDLAWLMAVALLLGMTLTELLGCLYGIRPLPITNPSGGLQPIPIEPLPAPVY